MGLPWMLRSHCVVRRPDMAYNKRCRTQQGEFHPDLWLLSRQLPVHASSYKHRNDNRHNAGHRHSSSIHELRRVVAMGIHHNAVHIHSSRPPREEIFLKKKEADPKGSVSCILYGDDELSEGSARVPLRFIHPSELRSFGSRSRGRGRPRSVRAFRQLSSDLH